MYFIYLYTSSLTVLVVVGEPRQSYGVAIQYTLYVPITGYGYRAGCRLRVRRRSVFDDASHTASVDRVKIINYTS